MSVPVDIIGDVLNEDDETLLLNISASNTTVAGSDLQALGTIIDNDPLPQLSINDVSPLDEGNGPAPTPFIFTLSLDAPSGRPVNVRVVSGDPGDTALAPDDYASIDQVVAIPAGMISMPVTVDVVGDTTFEPLPTESFSLKLAAHPGGPLNANLADALGIGTITNDDGAPGTLQFSPNPADQSVMENVGTATFTVTRSGGSTGAVSTTVALGGNATIGAGNDYTASNLVLTWADGDATDRAVTITVTTMGGGPPVDLARGRPAVPSRPVLTLRPPGGPPSPGPPRRRLRRAGSLRPPNPADQSVAEGRHGDLHRDAQRRRHRRAAPPSPWAATPRSAQATITPLRIWC
ncbi:MAG: hypothetical protein IPP82_00985 [Xanthomonadales bacterium]|nr:hypothetical protein [Xanthomonadales bacterium]